MIRSCVLAIALAAIAGCYAPRPPAGSPCDDEHPCPAELVCSVGLCARTAAPADAGPDAPPTPGCVATGADICGDGIDQDCVGGDAACEVNDKPEGAIDVTAGGAFMPNFALATDDLASLAGTDCENRGGREVFYQVTLVEPQLYYFDTFGADIDTSVRVFGGMPCTAVTDVTPPLACSDDACDLAQSQLVATLPAGASCVVLDQNSVQAPGKAQLRVTPAGRTGQPLARGMASVRGDTCNGTDRNHSPSCIEGGAKDDAYWFTACPEETLTLDASTCNQSTVFDSVLAVRTASGIERLCNDDGDDTGRACAGSGDGSIVADLAAPGPGLYFVIVDGFKLECGNYQLVTNLR